MADFKVIETQEDFDNAVKERLARKDQELAKQYEGYMSPDAVAAMKAEYEKRLGEAGETIKAAQEKLIGHDKIVSDLTARATAAEGKLLKNRIAHEKGIPLELAGRLIGNTEEELMKDAESMAVFFAPPAAPPLRSTAPGGQLSKDASLEAAYAALAASLNPQT